mgnify:CR=1 FL=1
MEIQEISLLLKIIVVAILIFIIIKEVRDSVRLKRKPFFIFFKLWFILFFIPVLSTALYNGNKNDLTILFSMAAIIVTLSKQIKGIDKYSKIKIKKLTVEILILTLLSWITISGQMNYTLQSIFAILLSYSLIKYFFVLIEKKKIKSLN